MRIHGAALIVAATVGTAMFCEAAARAAAAPTTQVAAPAAPATQQPPAQQPPAAPTAPPPGTAPAAPTVTVPGAPPLPMGRVFASDAGMIFSAIRPDKVMDFETVLGRIHEALSLSKDPVRRQQAAGWKVFKAIEPGPNASVLYVFVMDPAVKGADYTVSKVLSEAFPAEVQEIYKLYNSALAGGQSLLSLQLLANYGEPFVPGTTGTKPAPAPPAGTPAGTVPPASTTPPTPTPGGAGQ